MRRHIDRHTLDACRKVSAVVQIKPAQEVLIGLAVATVLRHHQTWHDFQYFTGAQDRHVFNLRPRHRAFAGGGGFTRQRANTSRCHDNFIQ